MGQNKMISLPFPVGETEYNQVNRALFELQFGPSRAIVGWLEKQLTLLDIENRHEPNETIFKQRQGAAQAISQLLIFIKKSKSEVSRVEAGPSHGGRNVF